MTYNAVATIMIRVLACSSFINGCLLLCRWEYYEKILAYKGSAEVMAMYKSEVTALIYQLTICFIGAFLLMWFSKNIGKVLAIGVSDSATDSSAKIDDTPDP